MGEGLKEEGIIVSVKNLKIYTEIGRETLKTFIPDIKNLFLYSKSSDLYFRSVDLHFKSVNEVARISPKHRQKSPERSSLSLGQTIN